MSTVLTDNTNYTNIANAIRSKGVSGNFTPAQMSTAIASIPGSVTLQSKSVTITNNGTTTVSPDSGYDGLSSVSVTTNIPGGPSAAELTFSGALANTFTNNKWTWFINKYGSQMTTTGITDLSNTFYNSYTLTSIPFTINLSNCASLSSAFGSCTALTSLPTVSGALSSNNTNDLYGLFSGCASITTVEHFFDNIDLSNGISNMALMFYGCQNLTSIPTSLLDTLYDALDYWYSQGQGHTWGWNLDLYHAYYMMLTGCQYITSIELPVVKPDSGYGDNENLNNTFRGNYVLSSIKFELENNAPAVVNWANQALNLSNYVGWRSSGSNPEYNSVYNHDSAVETINTLPDASAYLTTSGQGTNAIIFKRYAGQSTSGGAINDLTAAEIAVATDKGWTVTLQN